MKKRAISFFLILGVTLGLILPAAQANAAEPAPEMPIFQMKVVADVTGELTEGDRFTVGIYGGPLNVEKERMISFQIDLQYPEEQLELLSIEPEGGCVYVGSLETNLETGQAVYNAGTKDGLELKKGDNLLATAAFRVRPTRESCEVRIGLCYAEITRPQDKVGQPVNRHQSEAVAIRHIPMLALPQTGSASDKTTVVTLHKNPAGTLFAAVYAQNGRLLRCAVKEKLPENAGAQTLELSMADGAYAKVFLLDGKTSVPLCAAARMELK